MSDNAIYKGMLEDYSGTYLSMHNISSKTFDDILKIQLFGFGTNDWEKIITFVIFLYLQKGFYQFNDTTKIIFYLELLN